MFLFLNLTFFYFFSSRFSTFSTSFQKVQLMICHRGGEGTNWKGSCNNIVFTLEAGRSRFEFHRLNILYSSTPYFSIFFKPVWTSSGGKSSGMHSKLAELIDRWNPTKQGLGSLKGGQWPSPGGWSTRRCFQMSGCRALQGAVSSSRQLCWKALFEEVEVVSS